VELDRPREKEKVGKERDGDVNTLEEQIKIKK
jgi:hypothetical protein